VAGVNHFIAVVWHSHLACSHHILGRPKKWSHSALHLGTL